LSASVSELTTDGESLTDFESKYRHSGHRLWALTANAEKTV
ncbi:MAG TPA: SAM-dependent methyltransferase, partial [Alcanivorax sp.]|nr:SAM-dependent methyltransferase [Alcanivorax sp.]